MFDRRNQSRDGSWHEEANPELKSPPRCQPVGLCSVEVGSSLGVRAYKHNSPNLFKKIKKTKELPLGPWWFRVLAVSSGIVFQH